MSRPHAPLADAAFGEYRATTREHRASFLEAIADNIEAIRDELVARAAAETGLPEARLTGEVGRTTGQLRMFAAVVREGSWNEARIDPAQPDRTPVAPPRYSPTQHRRSGRSLSSAPATSRSRSRWPAATPPRRWPPAAPSSSRRTTPIPEPPNWWAARSTDAVRAAGLPAGTVLAAVRLRPRARHRARHRSPHQGGRVHRIPFRRDGAGGRGGRAARADPRVRRDELDQPGVPARRCTGQPGRRHRSRLRGFADDGLGTVLHQPRAGDRGRQSQTWTMFIAAARDALAETTPDCDADAAHRRQLSSRRRGAAERGQT